MRSLDSGRLDTFETEGADIAVQPTPAANDVAIEVGDFIPRGAIATGGHRYMISPAPPGIVELSCRTSKSCGRFSRRIRAPRASAALRAISDDQQA